jgi:hypothetical protein
MGELEDALGPSQVLEVMLAQVLQRGPIQARSSGSSERGAAADDHSAPLGGSG